MQKPLRVALIAAVLLLSAIPTAFADSGRVDLPRFPSISPDGSELVFSWGGDLWRASVDGGEARRLTRHNLDDLYSSWGPDGEWLTFASMRDGYMNLWRIHRDGTRLSQITHSDRFIRNPAYAMDADGNPVITFSSLLEGDVYRSERPYSISPEGGEHQRLHEAFGSEPRLSPDGRHVAFTRGGYYHNWSRRHYRGPEAMNLWLYDRDEERFTALTDRDGDDGQARWVNDRSLAFMSDRNHATVNLYRLDLDNRDQAPEQLTFFEGRDIQHYDISRGGSTAVMQVWDRIYTLDLTTEGAEPQQVSLRAGEDGRQEYELRRIQRDVTEAALSPDGKTMAYIAYGRVYVRHMDEHSPTRAVTPDTHARHQNLTWSPDGLLLYFTNDEDGTESIYRARVALTRGEIRQPGSAGGSERGAVVATRQGSESDYARDEQEEEPDDPAGGQAADPDDPFGPADPGLPTYDPMTDPDPPEPLTEPTEPESEPVDEIEPEPRDDLPSGFDPARWHDAVRFSVRPVVQTAHNDRDVAPSPDGRSLAFRRGLGNLMILDLASGDTRTLVEHWDSRLTRRWSPDGRYIAYAQNDLNFSSNIFVVPADGSAEPVNITRHPRNDLNPRWSADGRKLSFISNRSGESYDLYRVYLDRDFETMTRRERAAYYRDARAAAEKRRPLPVTSLETTPPGASEHLPLQLTDAWRRIERVTGSPAHQTGNEMTPGGDRYLFNSRGEGLIVMNRDRSERKRLGPDVDVQHLTLTGDRVVYIENGRVGVAKLSGGDHQRPDIDDRIRIDIGKQSLQKFHEAARLIGEHFYHPDMKGLDWPALTEEYAELIKRTRTASEFSDIANRLMGELAASHTGLNNPDPGIARREPSGRLGIDYEPVRLSDGNQGYRVTHVVPRSPADLGATRLQVGDVVTHLDLQHFDERDSLLERLRGRVGQEVIVTFERQGSRGSQQHRTLLTPVDFGELSQLRYDAFRETSRQRVRELSDGRLGYIHIQSMNQSSLEEFQGDLYATAYGKEGLIIDVRNNGGGSTTDRILTSIMAGQHAYTIPIGADPGDTGYYPQDRLDAPRYTLPINMLANEKSYSNAEILAHAFRTLGRGTLVGEQTYGGVISTGRHTLIDGATVRRPFRGWYLPDGTDMEHNGAVPDIRVTQTPEDEVAGEDRQLDASVRDMLERLDSE